MKKGIETTFVFILKNILYVVLSIGYPIGYLYFNYDIYETLNAVTKLKLAGSISLIIIIFFAKGMLEDYVFNLKLEGWQGIVKKTIWGISRVLPMVGILLIVTSLTFYSELVTKILTYTILSNSIVYFVAPSPILNKKNKVG